jgi:maltooligosyltrehalose trehalohydrolase
MGQVRRLTPRTVSRAERRSPLNGRHHTMPFGAEVMPDGRVRFRLWAPDASRVELCLEDWPRGNGGECLTMAAEQDGWFGRITDVARPGTLYRYRIDGSYDVADPASRFQPFGVHGPSQVIDSRSYEWRDLGWRGRSWEEAVLYELRVGAFTPQGTFKAAARRLPYLKELGVTAIELMPVAAFPGRRGWGYDGVFSFAPLAAYGSPDELRALVEAAHAHGLMVLLDVVYNHFGPEGNHLHRYARDFFSKRHETPWGDAINFDGPNSRTVRSFFVHNALYWLDEYHFDGLRLDAVHAIEDHSRPDILEELAAAVARGPGRGRRIHLVLENHANQARYLARDEDGKPRAYTAQWNDDFHHAAHALLTGERGGTLADFADQPLVHLERVLCEGFAYQGERSHRLGASRGEPSGALPPTAFIAFLQNHDQVGNRPFGDRLVSLTEARALRAMVSILLLSPAVPALFMGEEFGCRQPFLYFADLEERLAAAVREGRLREHEARAAGTDPSAVPDPRADETFLLSSIDWTSTRGDEHRSWLELYVKLLGLRHRLIVPRLGRVEVEHRQRFGPSGIIIRWRLDGGAKLSLLANLGNAPCPVDAVLLPAGRLIHGEPVSAARDAWDSDLDPWNVSWHMQGVGERYFSPGPMRKA